MSLTSSTMGHENGQLKSKKRRTEDVELEIDVTAPEPPSRKALRKAKKQKLTHETEQPPSTVESGLKRLSGTDGEKSKFGIWIGNLLFTTTKQDLYKYLITNSTFPLKPDQITRIHLPPGIDRKAENKGFAYVDLVDQDIVNSALALSETLLGGRRLLIKDSNNFQGRPEIKKPKIEPPANPLNRKIFVGNLAFDATKDILEEHFRVCGTIVKSQLATFEDSGKCKGYGWIEFESLTSAETAMKGQTEIPRKGKGDGMKKVWLHRMGDRKLRMEYAEDSTTRYNKRYVKNVRPGTSKEDENETQDHSLVSNEAMSEPVPRRPQRRVGSNKELGEGQTKPIPKSEYRYDRQTVQKMTGAMVEGQGSKVIF